MNIRREEFSWYNFSIFKIYPWHLISYAPAASDDTASNASNGYCHGIKAGTTIKQTRTNIEDIFVTCLKKQNKITIQNTSGQVWANQTHNYLGFLVKISVYSGIIHVYRDAMNYYPALSNISVTISPFKQRKLEKLVTSFSCGSIISYFS
jgi:hypothetical protein